MQSQPDREYNTYYGDFHVEEWQLRHDIVLSRTTDIHNYSNPAPPRYTLQSDGLKFALVVEVFNLILKMCGRWEEQPQKLSTI